MRKLKVNDEVVVIAGKDKGRTGKILSVSKDASKVKVEGVNIVKKHVKPNPYKNTTGGIVPVEARIDISNVAIFNKSENKKDKVQISTLKDGTKVRVFKSTGQQIDT